MGKEIVNLGFRCGQDAHQKLRAVSFERQVSINQVIDEAVGQFFTSGEAKPQRQQRAASMGAANRREAEFLEEMLGFFRDAPSELIRDVRGLATIVQEVTRAEVGAGIGSQKDGLMST